MTLPSAVALFDASLLALFAATVALVAYKTIAVLRPVWLGRPAPAALAALPMAQRQEAARQHLARCAAGLPLLAAIAQAAPFVGLMGTCLHIIAALHSLGAGNIQALAQPIGQALYATLWGLAAAVPASVAYNLLVARLAAEAEALGVAA